MLKKYIASSPRSARVLRRFSFIGGLMVIAAGPVSCSVVDDEVVSYTPPATERKTVEKVTRIKKSYAYDNTSIVSATLRADDAARPVAAPVAVPSAMNVSYNPAAYICSPSGFGQKSRCFLR